MNMSQNLCPDRAWVQCVCVWGGGGADETDDKQETNKHDAFQ